MEDIEETARHYRKHVREFIQEQQTLDPNPDMIEPVKNIIQEIESQRDTVVGKLDHTLDLIKIQEDKVKKARSEVLTKTSADISSLENYIGDQQILISQASLVELGQYLVEKASDPEVVVRAPELPSSVCQPVNAFPPPVSFLEVGQCLQQTEQTLETTLNQPMYKTTKVAFKASGVVSHITCTSRQAKPVERFSQSHSVTVDCAIHSLVLNPDCSQLVIRTDHSPAPIKMYDLNGRKRKGKKMGRGIDGLTDRGGMSLDSHRDLYLAACDGHLTTVTMDGQRKDRIDMEGCKLSGVTYIRENDLYVVSDITNDNISLIDPRTKSVVQSFGSKGTSSVQFNNPAFITTYPDQGKPVIVVSDCNNNRVHLIDLYGTHLHTYGSKGRGDGQLYNPCDITTDPTGRITVCDAGNDRVTSFWTEDGQDKWQCLVSYKQRNNWPRCVDIDTEHGIAAVGLDDGVLLYYSCNR